jgi:chaperonin GroES
MEQIHPTLDRIVVTLAPAEQTSPGGVILPPDAQEKPRVGTVLAVGPGRWADDGSRRIRHEIEVGDVVLFSKYGGTELTLAGEEYVVIAASEVLVVLGEGYEGRWAAPGLRVRHLDE